MKTKQLILLMFMAVLTALTSCTKNEYEGKCVIEGIANPRFNGKQIFIVPMDAPYDATRIDSMVVKDCMFRFVRDTTELCRITVERRARFAVQDLLVVTEPGVLHVTIDTISDSYGTRQNDSLSVWKAEEMEFNKECYVRRQLMKEAHRSKDTLEEARLKAEIDTLRKQHKIRGRQLADNLGEGPLYEYLWKCFPLTYQRRMPDGTIVEVAND